MTSSVLSSRPEQNVVVLTLNRPERKNAFNGDLMQSLADQLGLCQNDDTVHVVVLTGAEGHFSSGMDMGANHESDASDAYFQLTEILIDFKKPLIAAVTGVAIGAGATVPLLADLIFYGDTLKMRFPFVDIGLAPEFCSSYTLPTLLGQTKAADMLFDSDWINAEKAIALGITEKVYPADRVLNEALNKAKVLAAKPQTSLRATKTLLRGAHRVALRAVRDLELQTLGELVGGEENIEAIMNYLGKN